MENVRNSEVDDDRQSSLRMLMMMWGMLRSPMLMMVVKNAMQSQG